MTKGKLYIAAALTIGGLLLGAGMHPVKAFALSDSTSASDSASSTATVPADPSDPSSTPADITTPSSVGDTSTSPSSTSTDPTDPSSTTTASTTTSGSDEPTSSSDGTTTTPTTNETPALSSATTPDPATTSSDPANQDSQSSSDSSSSTPQCPTTNPADDSSDPSSSTSTPTTPESASLNNNSTINNCVAASSQSGNASVATSPQGGNATTGSANTIANLINALQSDSSLNSGNLQTFIDNLTGNITGNITINPADFINSPAGSTSPIGNISNSNNGTINNTVDLTANSGNATVTDNGIGGNATSGSAMTEANLINLLDAIISDNQSFLGVINIYGNLLGNILIPQSLVSSLLGSPSSPDPVTASPATVDSSNNLSINNQVTLAAQSGDAAVTNNNTGGNATSGNASTNLNIYNFTNSDIVGGNLLLVFVNVSGNWVGLLLNEPAGSTSAALGGQIQQYVSQIPTAITSTNTESINNLVNLSSTTGNATVSYNRVGGNATTGNATADANIVNIIGSDINLTGWLGILIINVFGSWTGNLGILPTTSSVVTPTSSTPVTSGSAQNSSDMIIYVFYPNNTGPASSVTSVAPVISNSNNPPSIHNLAITPDSVSTHGIKNSNNNDIIGIIGVVIGAALISLDRLITFRQHKKLI